MLSQSSSVHSGRVRRFGAFLFGFGFDPHLLLHSLRNVFGYCHQLVQWTRAIPHSEKQRFRLKLLPILSDRTAASGVATGHYFHQDIWAARAIFRAAPRRHVDVGSRIDGFVAHLLCFRSVEVVDIRELHSEVPGLTFVRADLMSQQPIPVQPADSVSCLHALEHFGLGRYGDPVQPLGWRAALRHLSDLVLDDGILYLSVPIGRPTVEFNAHRIFLPSYIVDEAAACRLKLVEFSYVDDAGRYQQGPSVVEQEFMDSLATLDYGCGLFAFQKLETPPA